MARCRTADGELPSLLSNSPCEVTCDLYIAQRGDGAFTITGECLKGQPTTRSSRHVDTAPRRDRDHRNGVTSLSLFTFMHWRRKWQPTPVFLPGESQGWGSLVGCSLWGRSESDTTEAT